MRFSALTTEDAVVAELGRRLARHRLERNWTQARLAAEAGIGQATLQRAERGQSVQMSSMIKLLRALDLLDGLDAAVPESIELPIARLEREGRGVRRRARTRRRHSATPGERSAAQSERPTAHGERPAILTKDSAATPEPRWRWGDNPGTRG